MNYCNLKYPNRACQLCNQKTVRLRKTKPQQVKNSSFVSSELQQMTKYKVSFTNRASCLRSVFSADFNCAGQELTEETTFTHRECMSQEFTSDHSHSSLTVYSAPSSLRLTLLNRRWWPPTHSHSHRQSNTSTCCVTCSYILQKVHNEALLNYPRKLLKSHLPHDVVMY